MYILCHLYTLSNTYHIFPVSYFFNINKTHIFCISHIPNNMDKTYNAKITNSANQVITKLCTLIQQSPNPAVNRYIKKFSDAVTDNSIDTDSIKNCMRNFRAANESDRNCGSLLSSIVAIYTHHKDTIKKRFNQDYEREFGNTDDNTNTASNANAASNANSESKETEVNANNESKETNLNTAQTNPEHPYKVVTITKFYNNVNSDTPSEIVESTKYIHDKNINSQHISREQH